MQGTVTGIQELLVRGIGESGLYIGCGTKKLIPLVLETWVKRIHPISLKPRLVWVDSGNRFDAYLVSRAARQRGLSPKSVLESIQLARPFTAFQFHEMLEKIPKKGTPPVVVISDLMGLFYDEELPKKDMERAFRQFQIRLAALQKHAIVIALLIDGPVPKDRQHLLSSILAMAKGVYTPSITVKDPSRLTRMSRVVVKFVVGATQWVTQVHGAIGRDNASPLHPIRRAA